VRRAPARSLCRSRRADEVEPFRNMTRSAPNKITLLECGLAPVLARVIDDWMPDTGLATLELSIEAVSNLSTEQECVQVLWDAGLVRVLQQLADKLETSSDPLTKTCAHADIAMEARRLVEALLERHVAICMGQHRRLGADRCGVLFEFFWACGGLVFIPSTHVPPCWRGYGVGCVFFWGGEVGCSRQ